MNQWLPGKTIIRDVAELAGLVSVLADPLVAIDGVDGAGKTTLAKHLSATLGWDRVDLDDHLEGDRRPFVEQIRFDALEKAVEPRPMIVSGIHMLEVLDRVGLRPDFLIYVVRMPSTGIPTDLDLIERDINPELSEGQPMPPVVGGIVPGKVTRGLWTYMHRWKPVTAADVVFAVPD